MPRPNAELRPHLAALTEALTAIANGDDPPDDPGDLFEQALTVAMGDRPTDAYTLSTTVADLMADNLARLRSEAGLRQIDLAGLMRQAGFEWTRQVVADAERQMDPDDPKARPPRRLTHEEMIALVALFGVPMAELWRVPPGVVIDLGVDELHNVKAAQMTELIVGRRGVIGEGGPTWAAAASLLAGTAIDRPAKRLWRTRRASERGR